MKIKIKELTGIIALITGFIIFMTGSSGITGMTVLSLEGGKDYFFPTIGFIIMAVGIGLLVSRSRNYANQDS